MTQLGYLNAAQAQAVTREQYMSLDADQRKVINDMLGRTEDDMEEEDKDNGRWHAWHVFNFTLVYPCAAPTTPPTTAVLNFFAAFPTALSPS